MRFAHAVPPAPLPLNEAGPDPQALQGVARLVQWYEALTPETLHALSACYAPQAHFQDPFNDVRGHAAIRQVFAHMFASLDAPRFVVTGQLVQGRHAFLRWEFHFRMRRWRAGQPQCIEGVSLLQLDAQGMVLDHRDYWDAAHEFYSQFPVLGSLMRWLRRQASAGAGAPH